MDLLRAVVVDDEQLARDELCHLLEQLDHVEVVGQAGNGVEALTAIERAKPNLVFLDVQMPGLTGFEVARRLVERPAPPLVIFVTAFDQHAIQAFEVNAVDYLLKPDLVFLDVQMPGLTGFEVARRLVEHPTPPLVIFVTAFDQHAIQAFEVNAVDYLLKPVDPARLEHALQRARRWLASERPINDQLEKIVRLVQERQARHGQVAVKVGERFLLVQADEIIFASLADDSINIVTGQVTGTSNYRTLDDLQARLDPEVFWRVHRSHLVNINKIKEIVPWFSRNYILRMKDAKATEIPVSRTQTRRLRDYLKL